MPMFYVVAAIIVSSRGCRYCDWFQERCVAAQELKLCSFPKTRMPTVIYNVGRLFRHLTGWWHGAIPSVAMLTVVHCYTYIVCC